MVQDVDASGVICSDEQRPNYTQLYETNEVEGKEHASLDLGMRKQPCIDVILGRHFSMPTQRMENSSDCDSNTHQTSALETPASNVLSPLSMRAEKPATPLSQDIGQNSQVCGSGLDIYNPFSCLQIDTSCSNKDGELVVQGEQVAEIETSEELKMEMSPNSAQDKSNTKDALKYVPPLVYNSVDGLRRSLRCNVPLINGSSTADMDSLEKAMNRAAARNLDVKGGSSIAAGFKQYNTSPCPGPHAAGNSQSQGHFTIYNLSSQNIITNLSKIGINIGGNGIGIEEAFETLRQAEKDRERDINNPNDNSLFESSDDEATYSESDLFAHLIQDVAETDHEKEELDTKLCDLVASNRKHKTSRKKHKNCMTNKPHSSQ